jgi:hypothetical protein
MDWNFVNESNEFIFDRNSVSESQNEFIWVDNNSQTQENDEYSITQETPELLPHFSQQLSPHLSPGLQIIGGENLLSTIYTSLFADFFEQLLENVNKRRLERFNTRSSMLSTRGRPKISPACEERRNRYVSMFSNDFSKEDISNFWSILITMSLCPQPTYSHYWKRSHKFYGNSWIQSIMSFARFFEILQCLDFNLDDLFKLANAHFKKVYNPERNISVDEMMIQFQGECPHHVYIKRKPHPHGMKVWAIVDSALFVYHIDLYKRSSQEFVFPPIFSGTVQFQRNHDAARERSTDTILRMISNLPSNGYVIYADSYFGS